MTCFKQAVNVENYAGIKKLISFELQTVLNSLKEI